MKCNKCKMVEGIPVRIMNVHCNLCQQCHNQVIGFLFEHERFLAKAVAEQELELALQSGDQKRVSDAVVSDLASENELRRIMHKWVFGVTAVPTVEDAVEAARWLLGRLGCSGWIPAIEEAEKRWQWLKATKERIDDLENQIETLKEQANAKT